VRENGTKVYCLAHGADHHHHLTCRSCGRTERIDVCVDADLAQLAEERGFVEVSHVLEVFGVCSGCARGGGVSS
jgi:Fe2+ or Zn2+ uptake regulation protein